MYIRLFRTIYMVDTTKMFITGLVIAVVYFLLKFMEMRFVDPENQKPIKVLMRDSIMVCISAVVGMFVLTQFDSLGSLSGGGAGGSTAAPAVFVDTPGF